MNRFKDQVFAVGLILFALFASSKTTHEAAGQTAETTMNAPTISLGYVILFVKDVPASLTFYEKAFGLSRRFFNDDNGKAYGELETGMARLAFASVELAKEQLQQDVTLPSTDKPPLGAEIALVTTDVPALYSRAVKAGATSARAPATMPWGQTVGYLRDNAGHLVELCTPLAK